jgi:hypothetical protein
MVVAIDVLKFMNCELVWVNQVKQFEDQASN